MGYWYLVEPDFSERQEIHRSSFSCKEKIDKKELKKVEFLSFMHIFLYFLYLFYYSCRWVVSFTSYPGLWTVTNCVLCKITSGMTDQLRKIIYVYVTLLTSSSHRTCASLWFELTTYEIHRPSLALYLLCWVNGQTKGGN